MWLTGTLRKRSRELWQEETGSDESKIKKDYLSATTITILLLIADDIVQDSLRPVTLIAVTSAAKKEIGNDS